MNNTQDYLRVICVIGELYYQVQHPIKRKKFIQISGIISLPQPKTEGEMYEL